MELLRFKAIEKMLHHEPVNVALPESKVSDYFGIDVFSIDKMRDYVSSDAYESVVSAITEGRRIERKVADQVANGMKRWAMERGVTHYTHWFQPLNESTAEKHDTFAEPVWGETRALEKFSGAVLVQQEPDASSFPNGGLRNTFEARGYSAWDPSSPTFIIDDTLCIPSIFIAYTGEALDYKTPLLRSIAAIDKAAVSVCQLFDKDAATKVVPTLGWEQEYFLVDEGMYRARPDLELTGRTLMGHSASKDQQLDDHYWGDIPERVMNFMKELEYRCFRLGIPVKTRHNEVAPNQYECAPMFEEANIAVDHNTLLMTIMRKVANKHHLQVLFHEKPYEGVNGSGKHCNWSLATIDGHNLLAPGRTPKSNTQFLAFFVATLKAACDYGTMIMASVATEGNSHRLGGHEAPPAVLSVFTGAYLDDILQQIEQRISEKALTPDEKTGIKLDIGRIPEIMLDNTDRNRTSPFAFTGNRFELRATGSSANCAMPLIVLNTAVAHELTVFKNEVETLVNKGVKKDEAILQTIRKFIIDSKKVRFEGNGYSEEWHNEAKRRGLRGIETVASAIREYIAPENIALFEQYGVMNRSELEARYEIKNETLLKKIQIESRVLGDLAANHIIPTAINYQNVLIRNVEGLKNLFGDEYKEMASAEITTIRKISEHVKAIRELSAEMLDARRKWNTVEDVIERAIGYENVVKPYISQIRYHIDHLEMIVDDRLWTLPKYRELFTI